MKAWTKSISLWVFGLTFALGLIIVLSAGSMAEALSSTNSGYPGPNGSTYYTTTVNEKSNAQYLLAFTVIGGVISLTAGNGLVQSLLKDWPEEPDHVEEQET